MPFTHAQKALARIEKKAARSGFWRLSVWNRWLAARPPTRWNQENSESRFEVLGFVLWLACTTLAVFSFMLISLIATSAGWVSEATFSALFPHVCLWVGMLFLGGVFFARTLRGLSPTDTAGLMAVEGILGKNPELMDSAVRVTGDSGPVRHRHVVFLHWASECLEEARLADQMQLARAARALEDSPFLDTMGALREKTRLAKTLAPAAQGRPPSRL